MPFSVVGKQGTLGQVRNIIEANAEFGGDSVVVVDASNIQTEQYREGDGLASDEVEDLIAQGRSDWRIADRANAGKPQGDYLAAAREPAANRLPPSQGRAD